MKFTCQTTINQPIDKVVQLFNDPNNLDKWQEGFVSLEHLSGTPGEPGAKSRLLYKHGKRDMELIETIQVNNLPTEMIGEYYHEHMTNTMRVSFTEVDANTTQYLSEIEYTSFRGVIPKIMGTLFPGMFKRQTQKWLDRFKAFAEGKV